MISFGKVFPYNNPAETYKYYSLPFCRPDNGERERQRFGELLVGDRKVSEPCRFCRFRVSLHAS